MDPFEPASSDGQESRRPLLMDPAGARPAGFAPPTVLTPGGSAQETVTAFSPPPTPGPPSVLAGSPAGDPQAGVAGEASFGPVSQVVRVSVRTVSSRIDLVLPDRSTFAETLETVLELAPRSLREQAIAHGGWILRTTGGEAVPGATTLLEQGVVDGTTLFLTGIDAADSAAVYDDVADAVADTVRSDPSTWPAGAGRMVALGAAGLFAAISCLSLLLAGPPWTAIAVSLGAVAVLAQVAAGLLSRGVGDAGAATVVGLLSVVAGAAAATVASAGLSSLWDIGAPQLLLGAAAATVLASISAFVISASRVPFVAIVTGSLLVAVAAGCCLVFELSAAGGAAILAGLALGLMPLVPGAALRLARLEPDPIPATADEGDGHDDGGDDDGGDDDGGDDKTVDADGETIDATTVRDRTRQAIGFATALVQGLTWTALIAGVVLAFSQDILGQILAGVVGVGLLLRARVFTTTGQRLPLLIAGIAIIAALLVAVQIHLDGPMKMVAVAGTALAAVIVCLTVAIRHRRASPALTRAAEIIEMTIAIAVIPLVAGVLGVFGYIRGLGG